MSKEWESWFEKYKFNYGKTEPLNPKYVAEAAWREAEESLQSQLAAVTKALEISKAGLKSMQKFYKCDATDICFHCNCESLVEQITKLESAQEEKKNERK